MHEHFTGKGGGTRIVLLLMGIFEKFLLFWVYRIHFKGLEAYFFSKPNLKFERKL